MTQENTISIEGLQVYVNNLSEKLELSHAVTKLLYEQVGSLGELYGGTIDRTEAIKIIGHQLEITKTGLIRQPVSIEEFVVSPEYMNQGDYVRPIIMEYLKELFNPEKDYYEVILGGGIGIGKNYFSDMAVAYIIYQLSCLFSPQTHYGLAPGSDIVFVHQSRTLDLARKVVFNQFVGRINSSGYFPRNFMYKQQRKAELHFPHSVILRPISSSDTAALGMNIFTAVLDEMNFMSRIKRHKKNAHYNEEEYDQAKKLYTTIIRRIESRYDKMGRVPGKLFLISSANYKGDFIDRKEDEAKTNPHIFVMHLSQWEAMGMDPKKYSGKNFWLRLPTEQEAGYILDGEPVDKENTLEVPVEAKSKFEQDFEASLRDLAGVPVARRSKFLPPDSIIQAVQNHNFIYGGKQLFTAKSVNLDEIHDLKTLLDPYVLAAVAKSGPFAGHIDLGLTDDSAGLAIGHVLGIKTIDSEPYKDAKTGKTIQKPTVQLPVYGIVGLLLIVPPVNGEVSINKIRDFVFLLANYLNLKYMTLDQFQSVSTIQAFRPKGIRSEMLQIDKKPAVYNEFKGSIRDGRVYIPDHEILATELRHLERDNTNGKVDHVDGGSKDLSDAVAGTVFNLSQLRSSYNVKHQPVPLKPPMHVQASLEGTRVIRTERPSSGRASIY